MSFSSLHEVLNNRDWSLEDIDTFLKLDSSSINTVNSFGYTPLIRILRNYKCSIDIVKLLLNYGSNINFRDKTGWTPLIIALSMHYNVDFIKLFIEKGAKINGLGPDISVFCLACRFRVSKSVIQLLLDAGCFRNECKSHGTALHCSIYTPLKVWSEQFVFQLFIKKRVDVNAIDPLGNSCLCMAIGYGYQISSIKILLAAGGVLICTKHTNPLRCATSYCICLKVDVVEFLLEQGAWVDSDVLQCALKNCICDSKVIELLFDHFQGADVKDVKDDSDNTLLHLAVNNPHVRTNAIKLLVKRGLEVNRVNINGDIALHVLVKRSASSYIVEILLKGGSQVNVENACCETPLHLAMKAMKHLSLAKSAYLTTFKLLYAAGARIRVTEYLMLKNFIEKFELNETFCRDEFNCLKMLVKCCVIEKPDNDFQYTIQSHRRHEELVKFGSNCVHELQKLNSNICQGRTLREFLRELSPFRGEADNFTMDAKSILFDQLLRIIAENGISLFLDIISAKVGRSTMKIQFQKLKVYTYLSDESRMGQKVVLNYDTVFKIGQLLNDEDLLRFISAFNKTDDHSCANKVSKENIN